MNSFDATGAMVSRVRDAAERGRGVAIRGGGTRSAWHHPPESTGIELDFSQHAGVIRYEPTELVATVRAGTPLRELEATLAGEGQCLPFDPPRFGEASTIGGAIATGASGPGRPWLGAARDAVLGVRIVDGRGEVGRFGGEVMKNVAGYDIARLQAGAFGTVGAILDVSLRVRALPECSETRMLELGMSGAFERMAELGRRPWPLTGLAWEGGRLYVRFEGSQEGVSAAVAEVGGERVDARFWDDLRDLRASFFAEASVRPDEGPALWRLSLPADAPRPAFPANWLLDWGGALRWCVTDADPRRVFEAAREMGGHALCLRPTLRRAAVAPAIARLEARVRAALDPDGVLNPGVMAPAPEAQ